MHVWRTTSLSVGEANSLVVLATLIVGYCMSLIWASVLLEFRRLMIIRGTKDAIIQDPGFESIWKAVKTSKSKRLTVLAALPMVLSYVASNAIGFVASGVSASVGYAKGSEVAVLGLAGEGVSEYSEKPIFPTIAGLAQDAESGIVNETAYLTLLSPELISMGFSSSFSDIEVEYISRTSGYGEEGVYIVGKAYEPPTTVSISFCVEVAALSDNNAYSLASCREHLVVEKVDREFAVVSLDLREDIVINDCSHAFYDIPLGNQGLGVVTRDMTLSTTGTNVAATCSSIFESVIESCVWWDSGILYFGDWNVGDAGECNSAYESWSISFVGIEYESKVEQGSDTAVLLAAMTAEIFGGTGLLSSRQQLVDILGAIVRLESMGWDMQIAYDPVEMVEVGVSLWIPLVFLLALVVPGIAWGVVKKHGGGKTFFLPVSSAEWSACAAREVHGDGGSLYPDTPQSTHYDQVYAFGPVVCDELYDGHQHQRLGWFSKHAVTPVLETSVIDVPLRKTGSGVAPSGMSGATSVRMYSRPE